MHVEDVPDPRRVVPGTLDVLQIHWPEQIFWGGRTLMRAAARGLETLFALRRLKHEGVRLVWMVHNFKPHNATRGKMAVWNRYSRAIARLVDGFVTLSPATLPLVRAHFGFAPTLAALPVRHPVYAGGSAPSRRPANTGERLHLVLVGAVRRYKGIAELAEIIVAVGHNGSPQGAREGRSKYDIDSALQHT